MNSTHESKITNFCVGKLINSGAITCIFRLDLGDFESHGQHPPLISASQADTEVVMKKIIGSLLLLPILLWITAPVAFASDATINTMSGIVMHLQHYPSNAEKQTLAKISQNDHATAGEKVLAGALMRMQHAVQGSDAVALQSLRSDKQASHGEQELADILLGISHKPSSSDMRRLKALLGT